ncbi:MAG: DNRLRE domain-containing protein [Verrucomicrobiota bacterium]
MTISIRSLQRLFISSVCIHLAIAFAQAQPYFVDGEDPRPSEQFWTPVDNLSDDFDDGSIDTAKWQLEPVGNGWNWIGRPPGLFLPENVTEADGRLRVTVSELDNPRWINGNFFTYQGAIVRSHNPGNVGMYFECKMKANATAMSSTFWLMTKYNCEKKLELDIQECVGRTSDLTFSWAKTWDEIYHSNMIHRSTSCNPEPVQRQGSMKTPTKNHERFYVYGAWWKSTGEVMFFLDGVHVYTIYPSVEWDVPAFIQMAIETYDWNPVPVDGGLVASGTWEQRTTQYEWVRTWQLVDGIAVSAGEDQSVILPNDMVTLEAEISDLSVVSDIQWVQISGPGDATLSGNETAQLIAEDLVVGTYTFELQVTDENSRSYADRVSVVVKENQIPVITTFKLPLAEAGSDYRETIAVESGDPPITWSLVAGSMPSGVNLSSGLLSGQPSTIGSSEFTLRVTDVNGDQDEQRYLLHTLPQLPQGTATVSPTDDAYLEGNSPYNNSLLKIEDGHRVSYLKFNVGGISGQIVDASLSMRVDGDQGNGTIRFFVGSHDNWTEDSLTNSNKPLAGDEVAVISGTFGLGNVYTADLTDFLSERGTGTFSLIAQMDNGGNDVWFASAEGNSAPSLAVTYREPIDHYAAWASLYFADLPGGEANELAGFDAIRNPGDLPNGFLYAYGSNPIVGGEGMRKHLLTVHDRSISFQLPTELPEDIAVWIEGSPTLKNDGGWPTKYEPNPDGSWPAPFVVEDNGDGTVTVGLPMVGNDHFFRLVFGEMPDAL